MTENPYQSPTTGYAPLRPGDFCVRWNRGWCQVGKYLGLLAIAMGGSFFAGAWSLISLQALPPDRGAKILLGSIFMIQIGGVSWAVFGALWEMFNSAVQEREGPR